MTVMVTLHLHEYFIVIQYHKAYFFWLQVLKRFPEGLQADICLHLNRHLLSTNPLFRAASPGCLRTLSLKLKTTHCPPGDYIIHYGDEIKNLYWIGRGTVEVIQNDAITAILGIYLYIILSILHDCLAYHIMLFLEI